MLKRFGDGVVLLIAFSLTLLASTLGASAQMQQETQEMIFPHMTVGGGYECELTIVAQGAGDWSTGDVYFYGQNGQAMSVSVNGGQPTNSFSYDLMYRSTGVYKLTSTGGLKIGWILVANDPSNNRARGSISGVLTYWYRLKGVLKSQIGVLPGRAISKGWLPFDNTNSNKTALALAMTGNNNNQATVTFRRYDEAGTFLETANVLFQPWSQQALYVYQLFPQSADVRGFIAIDGSAPFNALALTDNSDNYSTTAVLPAVFERDLTITVGDKTTYTVRLTREGNYFAGVADRLTPSATTFGMSGNIMALPSGSKLLQLTLHAYYPGSEREAIVSLVATLPDENLGNMTGRVYLIDEYGSVRTGTFTMYPRSMATF